MLSWLSHLLGTPKGFQHGLDLIDAACYTEEERLHQKVQLLRAYEPFRLTQRLLALLFCFTFLSLLVVLLFLSFWCDISYQLTFIERYVTSELVQPISIILGFYFAGGMLEGVFHTAKRKVRAPTP